MTSEHVGASPSPPPQSPDRTYSLNEEVERPVIVTVAPYSSILVHEIDATPGRSVHSVMPLIRTLPDAGPDSVRTSGTKRRLNVAPTTLSAVAVTVHEDPVQSPSKPLNDDSIVGDAVSETLDPKSIRRVQFADVCPNVIVHATTPLMLTLPPPGPRSCSASETCRRVNVAPTLRGAVITTAHEPPAQSPSKPLKSDSNVGVAVSDTLVP